MLSLIFTRRLKKEIKCMRAFQLNQIKKENLEQRVRAISFQECVPWVELFYYAARILLN